MSSSFLSVPSPLGLSSGSPQVTPRARRRVSSRSPARVTVLDTRNPHKYLLKKRSKIRRRFLDKITKEATVPLNAPIISITEVDAPRRRKKDKCTVLPCASPTVVFVLMSLAVIVFGYLWFQIDGLIPWL